MLGDTRFEPRSQVRQFSCTDLRRDAPERMDDTACTGPVGVGQGLTKLRSVSDASRGLIQRCSLAHSSVGVMGLAM